MGKSVGGRKEYGKLADMASTESQGQEMKEGSLRGKRYAGVRGSTPGTWTPEFAPSLWLYTEKGGEEHLRKWS